MSFTPPTLLTSAAPVNVTKAAAAVGISTDAARSDHKHDVDTAAPATVGTANAEGTATSIARSDHVHDHGAQTSGTLHAAVIAAGASGFMTGADKTKLDGIATGAARALLVWGNNSIAATTTTRFLSAGFDSALASTTEIPVPLGSAGVLRNLYVRHNTATGNGNSVVYTVMVNGVASALTVSLATNAIGQASDTVNTVAIVAGDRVSIQITKAASVGTAQTDVTASFEVGAA